MPNNRRQYAITWAGLPLPPNVEANFAVIGTKGTGKTLVINTLMKSVLQHLHDRSDDAPAGRAVVFDSKTELYPLVCRFAPAAKVLLVNPFDRRCHAWDVARDVDSVVAAQELAAVFIPDNPQDAHPFFRDMAAQAVTAVFEALHLVAKDKWTLWHAYQILSNPDRFKYLVRQHHSTAQILDTIEQTETAFLNILATVMSKLAKLKVVAALWDQTPQERRFSLRDWVGERNTVLLLTRPKALTETVTALNRVLFKRLQQLLTGPAVSKEGIRARGRTWFFLDECRNLGRLDGLNDILTEGRSFGLRTAIGFQDIDGFRHGIGDEKLANEIVNLCDHLSVLRCQGETAEWASKMLGDREVIERQSSMSQGKTGWSQVRSPSPAVMPSEIRQLPTVDQAGGIAGYHLWPGLAYATGTRFDSVRNMNEWSPPIEVDFAVSPRDLEESEKFMEWPDASLQVPREWRDDEWLKLGIAHPTSTKAVSRGLPSVDDLRG